MNTRRQVCGTGYRARVVLAATAVLAGAGIVGAQTPLAFNGGVYTQNFDGLPANGFGTTAASLSGAGPHELSAGPISASGLEGWAIGATNSPANTLFRTDNGSGTSGAIYSYGATGSGERALGALGSGTFPGGGTNNLANQAVFGVALVNNTSTTYGAFDLSFVGEQWRYGGSSSVNVLRFTYAVGGDGTTIRNGSFVPVPQLNFTRPVQTGSARALDGNSAANRTELSATVASGFSWAPGQVLVLRWGKQDDAGTDDGLAIDDLRFEPLLGGFSPANLTWNRTVNGNWDQVTPNWVGDRTVYTEGSSGASTVGDKVTFTDSGAGVVTIDAAGVRPNSVIVNADGDYMFVGGPIGGATGIAKGGNGTLTLSSPNPFTGGAVISGGAVHYVAGGLGTGTISATGLSTVRAMGAIDSAQSLQVAQAGATFDTGDHAVTLGALSVGQVGVFPFPEFRKDGSGDLTVRSMFTAFGSRFAISGGRLILDPATPGGTHSIGANFGADFTGSLRLEKHVRLEIAAADGEFRRISGGGQIIVRGSGRPEPTSPFTQATLTQLVVVRGAVEVQNAIVINPDDQANFVASLGATAGGGFVSSLIISGPVTGNTDINFGTGVAGGAGDGIVELRVPLQHTGRTLVNQGAGGIVRVSTDDALPPGTQLIFGNGTNNGNTGAIDLNGRTLSVDSLATLSGTNPAGPANIGGIGNSGGNATLVITGDKTTTFTGGIGSTGSTNLLFVGNTDINLRLAASHTGHLTLTGSAGTVNYTGSTTVEGGKLTFATAYRAATAAVVVSGTGELEVAVPTLVGGAPVALEVGSASLSGSGRLTVAPGSRAGGVNQQVVAVVSSLSITGSAFLDLTNNDLIVRNGDLASLRGLVRGWLVADNGLPGAVGLGSSAAFYPADGALTTLAVYDNSAGLIGNFNGVAVTPADVIVKYTYVGDTDLSGTVDAADLSRVLQGLNGGGSGWNFGDVNYDGVVDFTDLGRVLAALRGQGAPLGQSTLGGGGGGVIPEPSAVGLLALAVPLMSRRRRLSAAEASALREGGR